jgi:hypothetical protein
MTPVHRSAVLAVVLLLLYGGISYWKRESMLSPGHLLAEHADIERACFRCHSPFRGADTARCVSCHRIDAIGLRTVSGATLFRAGIPFHRYLLEGSCAACHTDHAGPDSAEALGRFEHTLLMTSALEECSDCHERKRPADAIHTGMKGACGACHDTAAWTPATFEHERYFRFDPQHPEDCQTCHTTPANLAVYTCYGCHEHTPRNVRSEHLEEGISEFENCETCHRSADEEEAERAWKKLLRKTPRSSLRTSRPSDAWHHDDEDDDEGHDDD